MRNLVYVIIILILVPFNYYYFHILVSSPQSDGFSYMDKIKGANIQAYTRNDIANITIITKNPNSNYVADRIIRVLLYDGCAGSSATHRVAMDILEAHGFKSRAFKRTELDKPEKNKYFYKAKNTLKLNGIDEPTKDDIMSKAYQFLNEEAISNNEIAFFKAYYESSDVLSKLDVTFSGVQRKNKLDKAICYVKDCFGGGDKGSSFLGYSVFAENGTIAKNLCFNRRQYPDVNLKVYLHLSELQNFIKTDTRKDGNRIKKYGKLISPGKVQYYEDLFAFVYTSDDNVFQESVNVWESLLASMVHINKDILINTLLPLKNTRKNPSHHDKSIQNYEEVVNFLKDMKPPADHFIRE